MAAATSPATGRTYGVHRVCAAWRVALSSFYDARRQEERPHQSPAGRRGPKPALTDVELLAANRPERPAWVAPKLMARVRHSGRGSNAFLRHTRCYWLKQP